MTFSLSSCYNDNEEDLYLKYPTSSACDTTAVTYSTSVAPIFATYCNGCHGGGNPSVNIATDNYDAVVAHMDRIKGCVHHESGFSAMPKDSSPLSTCDLAKIDIWIRDGMQNN